MHMAIHNTAEGVIMVDVTHCFLLCIIVSFKIINKTYMDYIYVVSNENWEWVHSFIFSMIYMQCNYMYMYVTQ